MKRIHVDGRLCIGPNFSTAEFALIKRNLAQQKGLDTLADSLAAAGNAQRLKILYLLYAHKEMCVCDLAEVLALTDSAVSQHLSRLKGENMVRSRREKQTIFYSLVRNTVTAQLQTLFRRGEMKENHTFLRKEEVI
ncbi:MAG: metalloregulator ArsR/SmtB family transcription factor [Bacteroidota bacterium]